jgi:general secretion pathway protein A
LEQIPAEVDIAFILNPKLTVIELLATICDDLGITYPTDAGIKLLVDNLNEFLLTSHQEGRRTVLIIDEAQNLSVDVLEQLRLLTNLETNQRKLLQIILLGQPELLDLLARNELRQLGQRVTARFHLEALSKQDVHEYIRHRLAVAGTKGKFFPRSSINRIYKISGGIPRVINLICDRALLGAYAENRSQVNTAIVNRAATEVLGYSQGNNSRLAIAASVILLVSVIAAWYLPSSSVQVSDPVLKTEFSSKQSTELSAKLLAQHSSDSSVPQTAKPENQQSLDLTVISNVFLHQPSSEDKNLDTVQAANLNRVQDIEGHTDAGKAFADLFALWGLVFEDQSTPPCNQAITIGLKCYSDLGGLEELRNLNRPAVISIDDQWATLSRLNNGVATFISGNRQFEVDAAEFNESWNGKYTLLWRTPPAYERPSRLGDEGPTIDWLSSQLSIAESQPLDSPNGYGYQQPMEDKIKQFQIKVGLIPNGIVGVKTWIHINSVEGVNIPFLKQELIEGLKDMPTRGDG